MLGGAVYEVHCLLDLRAFLFLFWKLVLVVFGNARVCNLGVAGNPSTGSQGINNGRSGFFLQLAVTINPLLDGLDGLMKIRNNFLFVCVLFSSPPL